MPFCAEFFNTATLDDFIVLLTEVTLGTTGCSCVRGKQAAVETDIPTGGRPANDGRAAPNQ